MQHPVPSHPTWHEPLPLDASSARAKGRPSSARAEGRPSSAPAAEEPRETDLLRGAVGQAGRRVRGWALTRQQLRALFLKRMLHARRSTRGFFAQVRPGDGAGMVTECRG